MIKDPAQIINELMEEIHHLHSLIQSKDTVIQNYQVIIQGYKNLLKDQKSDVDALIESSQNLLELVEIDLKNPKSVMNAFLIIQRQNQKLQEVIKEFKESIQVKKRLN